MTMRDFSPNHDWLSINTATVRKQRGTEVPHTRIIDQCAERGIREPETIAYASTSILAVMDGLQVQWLLDPTALDLGRASEFAIEAIVASVLDPVPSPLV